MIKTVLTPVRVAFFGSLILSLVALSFEPVLGRDAAFYVDNARIFFEQGAGSLLEQFSWPWLSALIGVTHKATGLSLIASAYAWIFLFTAGTCVLLVRCVEQVRPEAGYWAVLVVLTMPAYNDYRHQIIREPGFWFFSSFVLLCMIFFEQCRQWRYLAMAIAGVLFAAIFRLEAAFMLVSIGLALIWMQRCYLISRCRGSLVSIALTCGAVIMCIVLLNAYADMVRVKYYLSMIDASRLLASLNLLAEDFRQAALHDYSYHHAVPILLSGMFMTIVFTALAMMGPSVVPFVAAGHEALSLFARQCSFIVISLLIYLLVLMVFFIQERFMINRYISFLHILLTPFIAVAFAQFWERHRRIALVVVVTAIIIGVANVVSTSSKRTHYFDAAQWVKIHVDSEARIFFYDPRIGFYADLGYDRTELSSSEALEQHFEQYDVFLVDLPLEHPLVQEKLGTGDLVHLASFDNGDGRRLIVLGKRGVAFP